VTKSASQDYIALLSERGVVTKDTLPWHVEAKAVHALIQLSEVIPSDGRFARQVRRQHVNPREALAHPDSSMTDPGCSLTIGVGGGTVVGIGLL
jgi:hypothetical protein